MTVTNSTAMSLSNTVRNPLKKDRHCWVNWTEYTADDVQSMKHCSTLTQKAKSAMETAVCRLPPGSPPSGGGLLADLSRWPYKKRGC